jgi:hypothetical protein
MICRAQLSEDGLYRYSLERIWQPAQPVLCYILLNPSTADATRDDATVRRCITRAINSGFGGIEIVNLFAMRSRYPYSIAPHPDPIGPENDRYILTAAGRAGLVICGWGRTGAFRGRAGLILGKLTAAGVIPHALKLNGDGTPCHPLYQPYSRTPFPFWPPYP